MGIRSNYSYDRAQRLVGATDNRGASITYTLDKAGNRIHEEVKDATGALALSVRRAFDKLGRLSAVDSATGQRTLVRHDGNGALVAVVGPLSQESSVTLDGLGRPVTTRLPDGATVQQAWSPLDKLEGVTDPKGVRTGYAVNAFGDVVSESSPDIGTVKYTRRCGGRRHPDRGRQGTGHQHRARLARPHKQSHPRRRQSRHLRIQRRRRCDPDDRQLRLDGIHPRRPGPHHPEDAGGSRCAVEPEHLQGRLRLHPRPPLGRHLSQRHEGELHALGRGASPASTCADLPPPPSPS